MGDETKSMSIIDWSKDVESLPSKIAAMIQKKKSFKVLNVASGQQSTAVELVERAIEAAGLTCRVRTENRGWLAAGLAVAVPVVGAAAAAAIASHNLSTKDPDYEVLKEMLGSDLAVNYMK